MESIEVITSVQRRRRWTLAEKLRAVEELNLPGMTVSYVARKYAMSPSLLFPRRPKDHSQPGPAHHWRRFKFPRGGHRPGRANSPTPATGSAIDVRTVPRLDRDGGLARECRIGLCGMDPRVAAVIRVDAAWVAVEPMDMRAGMETALARVVKVFGAARPHHAHLFANRRANRIKVLIHFEHQLPPVSSS